MRKLGQVALCAIAALFVVVSTSGAGESAVIPGDVYKQFDREEVMPYIKMWKGVWASNVIKGGDGDYRITAMVPRKSKFVVGLFDSKIRRAGEDERCAVVLVDGVNPLNPEEKIDIEEIDSADVSGMRKVAMNGMDFNATDNNGKPRCLIVVDAKEEYEFGEVRPFEIPESRKGKVLGRVNIIVFAGPAMPPQPGQVVKYGKPLTKFSFVLQQEE
jgi:hypothetical protein